MLEDLLYEAIYVPEGFEGEVPRSVIYDDPKCRAAYLGFGALPDDRAMVAVTEEKIVGACWVRTLDEYGHIDGATPSFSISPYKPYRGRGVGTAMMHAMLDELHEKGYARCSLSVQKENPALRLYERLGFRIVGNGFDETEWLMVADLAGGVRTAGMGDAGAVHDLVQRGIRAAYPGCYEPAVVEAFCKLHGKNAISSDVGEGKVRVIEVDGRIVATGTLDGNHITRVFVSPELRGKGHGSAIMDDLERMASASHSAAVLDSSAPAERFYLRRGYRATEIREWAIEAAGNLPAVALIYKVMEKPLDRGRFRIVRPASTPEIGRAFL